MSPNARLAGFGLGAVLTAAGVITTMAAGAGAGLGMLLIGPLIIASLGLERRYGRANAPTDVPPHAWEPTGERFVDQESGRAMEVWHDPLTGERKYEPIGRDPRFRSPR